MSTETQRATALGRKRRALARRRLKRRAEGIFYATLCRVVRPRPRPPLLPPRRVLLLLRGQRRGDAVIALAFSAAVKRLFPGAETWAAGPETLRAVLRCDSSLSGFHSLPHPAWRRPLAARRAFRELRARDFDLVFVLGIHFASTVLGRWLGRHAVGYDYNHRGFALDRALVPHVSCNRSGWEYGAETRPPHVAELWLELLADCSYAGPSSSGGGNRARPAVSWQGLDLQAHRGGARAFLSTALPGEAPLVVFHPYATERNRSWPLPLARRFLERALDETEWRLVLTGAEADRTAAECLAAGLGPRLAVAAGWLALPETWALLGEAALLVSIDTSLVHMAVAAGRPVVALYGPSDPLVWGPYGQAEAVLQANQWCQRCKRPRCIHPGVPCMEALLPEAVLERARHRLRPAALND